MTERDIKPDNAIDVPCPICNAKPGERCWNLLDASKYRDLHARRIDLSRATSTEKTA